MKNHNLSNEELELKLGSWIQQEVQSTSQIVELIAEADRRHLHLERGFPTLLDWLVQTYKYSEQSAQRRIQAARYCRAVPEVAKKIESGEVTLTSVVKAQSVIRAQEKLSGESVSSEMKGQILGELEGKSAKQAERILADYFPQAAKAVSRYKFESELSEENQKLFARIKELHSHAIPDGNTNEILKRVFKEHLKRHDPLEKTNQEKKNSITATSDVQSREATLKENSKPSRSDSRILKSANFAAVKQRVKISASLKRQLIQNSNASCSYQDPVTKRICGSRYQLEIDHIKPLAIGGTNEQENLRCLCRQHNKLMAIKNLGEQKIIKHFG